MSHKYKNPEVEEDFNYIMDVFSGADNTSFVNFLFFLRQLDNEAAEEKPAAKQLLKFMSQFAKLIRLASLEAK